MITILHAKYAHVKFHNEMFYYYNTMKSIFALDIYFYTHEILNRASGSHLTYTGIKKIKP